MRALVSFIFGFLPEASNTGSVFVDFNGKNDRRLGMDFVIRFYSYNPHLFSKFPLRKKVVF